MVSKCALFYNSPITYQFIKRIDPEKGKAVSKVDVWFRFLVNSGNVLKGKRGVTGKKYKVQGSVSQLGTPKSRIVAKNRAE